jgi:hypothetical protein
MPADYKEEKGWVKNILRIFIVLALIICIILVFVYSKELKNALKQTFSFTNHIYDRIFNRSGVVSEIGTSTIAINVTSTAATSISVGNTVATSVIEISPTTTVATTTVATTTIATTTGGIPADNIAFNSAINQSRALWAGGKYSESLAMAQASLQIAQNDKEKSRAQYLIGLCYYSQGNKEESEKAELLAVDLYPGYEPPYTTLSAIKLDKNECGQALTYAQKALQLNQNDPWAHNNLGLAYLCSGDKENAVIQFEKAHSLAPGSSVILNNLNIALESLGG